MKLVVDANVVISALVADSKTRELLVTLDPDLLTPAFVHDEIENYTGLVVEKSGMSPRRVEQFVDLLFQHFESFPQVSSIRTSSRPNEQSVTRTPTTCCTSRVRSPVTPTSGATIPISTNRTSSRLTRRAT